MNVAPVGGTGATALQSDRGDRGVQDDFTSPQAAAPKQSSKGTAALRPSGRCWIQKTPPFGGVQVYVIGATPTLSFLEPHAFFRRVRRCQVALKFLPVDARLSGEPDCSLSPDAACRGKAADRFADSHK